MLVNGLALQRKHYFNLYVYRGKRQWYTDASFIAMDFCYLACWQIEARIDQAEASVSVVENGICRKLNLSIMRFVYSGRDGGRGMSKNSTAEIDRVATNIHQRASCKICL